jgi:hypothetical protein
MKIVILLSLLMTISVGTAAQNPPQAFEVASIKPSADQDA